MELFEIYRNLGIKAQALASGELGFTRDKYENTVGIEDPADILEGMTSLLDPYVFSGDRLPIEVSEELLDALWNFQDAFDVDLQEELDRLEALSQD